MTRIAVVGPGAAGISVGVALQAAGAEVSGFDLTPAEYLPLPLGKNLEDVVRDADVVLAFPSAQLAEKTAQQIAPLLTAGALYSDFSAGTPEHKKRLANIFEEGIFADAALTSAGEVEAAGSGAQALIYLMSQMNQKATFVSEVPGDVAARTSIRALFTHGLAEVITDTLWAAESLGIEDWAWSVIREEFIAHNDESAQALIDDIAHNFKRHQITMQDVVELLANSGYESTMIAPIQFTHGRIMHGMKIPFSQVPKI
jgi:L-threonate 2-dehydrogenase